MFDGITHIVALGGHPMTGKNIEGIFEYPYVFFVTWNHDGMHGVSGHEEDFLLALFFACYVGFTANLEDFFDRVAGLTNGAAEMDGKEKCK